ncbi:unnamed protein product [Calypogeia fissa]
MFFASPTFFGRVLLNHFTSRFRSDREEQGFKYNHHDGCTVRYNGWNRWPLISLSTDRRTCWARAPPGIQSKE